MSQYSLEKTFFVLKKYVFLEEILSYFNYT